MTRIPLPNNGSITNATAGEHHQARAFLGVDDDRQLDAFLTRRDRAQRLVGFYSRVEAGLRGETPREKEGAR